MRWNTLVAACFLVAIGGPTASALGDLPGPADVMIPVVCVREGTIATDGDCSARLPRCEDFPLLCGTCLQILLEPEGHRFPSALICPAS